MTVDDLASAANPDLTDSLTALRRMALMARELAVRTFAAIVIVPDGKLVTINAEAVRRTGIR